MPPPIRSIPKLTFTPESLRAHRGSWRRLLGVIALRKDFPAKNLNEFIAYTKSNPGKVNLGHAGVGSSNFLICKGVRACRRHRRDRLVGYAARRPALTDAIGGQNRRRLRCRGVRRTADQREAGEGPRGRLPMCGSPRCRNCRPRRKAGLPDFEAQGWNGLFAPKGNAGRHHREKLNVAARRRSRANRSGSVLADPPPSRPGADEHTPECAATTRHPRRREVQRKLLAEK